MGITPEGRRAVVVVHEPTKYEQYLADEDARANRLPPAQLGQKVFEKNCTACHTTDGTIKVGPSFKGSFGTKVQVTGGLLRRHLLQLQRDFAWIGDVRGRGLMLGMEIVNLAGTPDRHDRPPADGVRAKRFQRACLEHGLILELGGRHGATVRFLPPLVITEAEVDLVARILAEAAREADAEAPHRPHSA